MRYRVVLFDVGETLVGPRESFGAVYARVLEEPARHSHGEESDPSRVPAQIDDDSRGFAVSKLGDRLRESGDDFPPKEHIEAYVPYFRIEDP